MTSYLRQFNSGVVYGDTLLVYASQLAMQGPSMYVGGLISERYGAKKCMMVGGAILVTGTLLASTVTTLWGLILTYGIPFGTGMGITYAAPIAESIKWMEPQKGLVTGIIVAGFGGGAFVFGQIAIAVVNPDNENVNDDTDYFNTDSAVPDRVPMMFIVLGCCFFMFYVIGILLVVEKPVAVYRDLSSEWDGKDIVDRISGAGGGGGVGNEIYHGSYCPPGEDTHDDDSDLGKGVESGQSFRSTRDGGNSSNNANPLLIAIPNHDGSHEYEPIGSESSYTVKAPEPQRSYATYEIYKMPIAWHVAACFVCSSAGGYVVLLWSA